MLRFALSGEGEVAPDILRKLPGRGVWTRLNRAVVRQAAAKQAFSRGFRAERQGRRRTSPTTVDRLLEQDALRFLSLVNKAGLVVVGGAKVEAAIRARRRLSALIHAARRGAATGRPSCERLLAGVLGERGGRGGANKSLRLHVNWIWHWGRTNVIHAALNAGPASAAFLAKVARLTLYRSGEAAPTAVATDAARAARRAKSPNTS